MSGGAVQLCPLEDKMRAAVIALGLGPGQEQFTGAPGKTVAIGDAMASREHVVIVRDGAPVGYFQLDRDSVPGAPSAPDVLGLRALLVDLAAQGQGVASAAMAALPAYVRRRFPDRRRVALTVNVTNPAAIAVYQRAGFADTGELYLHGDAGPQHVLLLDLRTVDGRIERT